MSGPGLIIRSNQMENHQVSLQVANPRVVIYPTDIQHQCCECCGADHLTGEDLLDCELCLYCKLMVGHQPLFPSTLARQCKLYPSQADPSQYDATYPNLDKSLKDIKEMYGY